MTAAAEIRSATHARRVELQVLDPELFRSVEDVVRFIASPHWGALFTAVHRMSWGDNERFPPKLWKAASLAAHSLAYDLEALSALAASSAIAGPPMADGLLIEHQPLECVADAGEYQDREDRHALLHVVLGDQGTGEVGRPVADSLRRYLLGYDYPAAEGE